VRIPLVARWRVSQPEAGNQVFVSLETCDTSCPASLERFRKLEKVLGPFTPRSSYSSPVPLNVSPVATTFQAISDDVDVGEKVEDDDVQALSHRQRRFMRMIWFSMVVVITAIFVSIPVIAD